MRIISDFRDYYDSMLALGQDFDLQFVRQRKLIFIDTYPFPKFGKSRHRFGLGYYWGWSSNDLARSVKCDLDVQDHVIGFCGQLYGCVKLSVPDPDQPPYSSKRISAFCYDIEAVDAFLEKHFSAKQLVEYHNPIRWKQASRTGRKWPGRYVRELFVHFFEDVTTFSNGFEKKFIEHNAPVITAEDKAYRPDTKKWQAALVINPCLQDFEFFRLCTAPGTSGEEFEAGFEPNGAQQLSSLMRSLGRARMAPPVTLGTGLPSGLRSGGGGS